MVTAVQERVSVTIQSRALLKVNAAAKHFEAVSTARLCPSTTPTRSRLRRPHEAPSKLHWRSGVFGQVVVAARHDGWVDQAGRKWGVGP